MFILYITLFQVPERVLLPASHFLVSLTTSVRPSFFVALETVQKLYHEVTAGKLRRTAVEVRSHCTRSFTSKDERLQIKTFLL